VRQAVISAQENRRLLETKYAELQNKLAQKVKLFKILCLYLINRKTFKNFVSLFDQ
jgi:hypothetical protein